MFDGTVFQQLQDGYAAEVAADETPEQTMTQADVAALIKEFGPLMDSPRWVDATPDPAHILMPPTGGH